MAINKIKVNGTEHDINAAYATLSAKSLSGVPVVETSGTSSEYTATIDGITELKKGQLVIIIPHENNADSPSFNLNDLGSYEIRYCARGLSNYAVSANWLAARNPVLLMFNNYKSYNYHWQIIGMNNSSNENLVGSVWHISNGGTGATSAAKAIENLGAMDLTSDQTTSGIKTFTNGILVGGATLSYDYTNDALKISFTGTSQIVMDASNTEY